MSEGTWTQLKGCTGIPEIGGDADEVSTDSLDNTKFHTSIDGLMPALNLDITFNMESPSATANIKLAHDLETAGTEYFWKITYTNGIEVTFKSSVKNSINAVNPNEIIGFTMHLSAVDEPVITVPTSL